METKSWFFSKTIRGMILSGNIAVFAIFGVTEVALPDEVASTIETGDLEPDTLEP